MKYFDFIKSVSNPYSVDTGNKSIQGMSASKTLQFSLFTTNENAVWAARNQLRKESFPLATASISVNRDAFRLQVGDVFKYKYTPYSSEELIMRVLQISEDDLESSENIIITAKQDVFSITNTVTLYTVPEDNAGQGADYSVGPFVNQAVIENPYVLATDTRIIPVAARLTNMITGFQVHMSTDGGSSYSFLENSNNVQPYGKLTTAYGLTYAIDDATGLTVEFTNDDVDNIESITWGNTLSGADNVALLGDEIISFQNITPVSGDIYLLENVMRGRFGTVMAEHSIGEDFWFLPPSIGLINDPNITTGAVRKFKLVPFNNQRTGDIADATPIDITIEGEQKKPYEPGNFNAEGESFNPLYAAGNDITLTWSPRYRGKGAGVGIPGIAYVDAGREGLFKIEVYVATVLVRTTTAIDAATWDYTNAMNVADNGAAAQTIVFKLYNYIENGGIIYESDPVEVTCNKE
jgi:hypothetical protein